jgi:hypothetical protein
MEGSMKAFSSVALLILSSSSLSYGADPANCTSSDLVCESDDQKILVCLLPTVDQAYVAIQQSPKELEQTFPYVDSKVGNYTYYTGPGFSLAVATDSLSAELDLSDLGVDEVAMRCR